MIHHLLAMQHIAQPTTMVSSITTSKTTEQCFISHRTNNNFNNRHSLSSLPKSASRRVRRAKAKVRIRVRVDPEKLLNQNKYS